MINTLISKFFAVRLNTIHLQSWVPIFNPTIVRDLIPRNSTRLLRCHQEVFLDFCNCHTEKHLPSLFCPRALRSLAENWQGFSLLACIAQLLPLLVTKGADSVYVF